MEQSIYPQDELDDSIPESQHVEIMFDALNDTVAGTEGMSMTQAQIYAAGVLGANGYRTGNEGFFGSIASGAKAVWDYIVKMFKSVWEFFFKRDAAAEVKEAEKEVKENAEALAQAPAAVQSMAGPAAQAHAEAIVKKLEGGEDVPADVTRAWLAELAGATTDAEKKTVATKVVKEVYSKIGTYNKKGSRKVQAAAEKVVRLNNGFRAWFEKQADEDKDAAEKDPSKGSGTEKLALDLFDKLGGFISNHPAVNNRAQLSGEIKTLDDAKHIQDGIQGSLKYLAGIITEVNGYNGKVKEEMSSVEKQLGSTKPGSEGHATYTNDLKFLRGLMKVSAALASYIKKSILAETEYSDAINKMFYVRDVERVKK